MSENLEGTAGQRSVLGKGLASLLQQQEFSNRDKHPGISFAGVDEIQANHYQPRHDFDDAALEELAQSIRANGIIQPLIVRKGATGYQLIAGERRLRAAKIAGLKQVPIVIRRSTDREALELALIENVQRENLNCVDVALAYQQLVEDFSLTQEEVAERVGKDRASVANHLRLLRLPATIIEDLKSQALSFGHGKALLSLEDNVLRMQARARILEKHLSVRETEQLVEQLKQSALPLAPSASAPDETALVARMNALTQELCRHWGTKVEIRGSERRGRIVLKYTSRQELDRLLEMMHTQKI